MKLQHIRASLASWLVLPLFLFMAQAPLVSCDDSSNGSDPVPPDDTVSFKTITTELTVDYDQTYFSYTLEATEDWTATSDADWLSLDKTSGSAADVDVAITLRSTALPQPALPPSSSPPPTSRRLSSSHRKPKSNIPTEDERMSCSKASTGTVRRQPDGQSS